MAANISRRAAPESKDANALLILVSAGELIDKITILAIKTQRVRHPQKRLMAAQELALLRRAAAPLLRGGTEPAVAIAPLLARLAAVNLALWEIEDNLRAMEQAQDFGARFVELARSVYRSNDERARLKNAISAAAGCDLMEVKQHPEY